MASTLTLGGIPIWQRVILVLLAAIAAHALVWVIRAASSRAMASTVATHITKTRTIVSLSTSAVVFIVYFSAVGFALAEIGVSLTTYFASASLIGLAVAFGSQGLVQDVVSGLTIVFTGLFDIGDMVEVSGQTGIVEGFGMRFTVLRSPLGAEVFIPNRSITNVVTYPRGYVRCLVDVTLPAEDGVARRIEETARVLTASTAEQFPGILRASPEITGPHETMDGKTYMRIKFRIWPGRGAPIEGFFREALLQAAQTIAPDYAQWMISVTYEVERYTPPAPGRRRQA